jgi:hypothetical protein
MSIPLKKLLPFLLFLLFLTGCGPTSTPVLTSGVEGHVTIGPTCPVVQVNNPCEDKPFQATLTVLNPQGKKVIQVQTDANGYYHLPLKPGEYVLHPESPNVMPHAADQPFTVQADLFTTLDIVYDSGIR